MWATFLSELWRWAAAHDGARVPTTTVTEVHGRDFMLGSRVKNARVYYRRGSLTEQQIEQLEAVPGWSWDGYAGFSANAWDKRIVELRAHVGRHGSVEGLHRRNGSLASWLRTQRQRDDLTERQRAELAKIPRALDAPTAHIDVFLALLRSWVAEQPSADASRLQRTTVIKVDGRAVALGQRAWAWRRKHATGQLAKEDGARLEAVPGWTWDMPGGQPGRRPANRDQTD